MTKQVHEIKFVVDLNIISILSGKKEINFKTLTYDSVKLRDIYKKLISRINRYIVNIIFYILLIIYIYTHKCNIHFNFFKLIFTNISYDITLPINK